MGFPTKVQVISRTASEQWYINFPSAVAQAMEFAKGETVEWIIADKLKAAGIKYQYEQPLLLDGVERLPDFTIRDEDAGTVWYWEHNGMLSDDEYKKRWERKKAAYKKANILPLPLPDQDDGRNGTLLITEEREGMGLDLNAILANINLILGRS